jgi:hypothetical protein
MTSGKAGYYIMSKVHPGIWLVMLIVGVGVVVGGLISLLIIPPFQAITHIFLGVVLAAIGEIGRRQAI